MTRSSKPWYFLHVGGLYHIKNGPVGAIATVSSEYIAALICESVNAHIIKNKDTPRAIN